jgi:hypothetical protein
VVRLGVTATHSGPLGTRQLDPVLNTLHHLKAYIDYEALRETLWAQKKITAKKYAGYRENEEALSDDLSEAKIVLGLGWDGDLKPGVGEPESGLATVRSAKHRCHIRYGPRRKMSTFVSRHGRISKSEMPTLNQLSSFW